MKHVLITVSCGIIDQVEFYDDAKAATYTLSEFVKTMDPEKEDAAVYDPNGMIINAKGFLDENNRYVDNRDEMIELLESKNRSIYIIGNPDHRLGFMVASPDDPLGYKNPVAALCDLGQMRQDHGIYLKLYQVITVENPIVVKAVLEQHNSDCEVESFDYSLVQEYLQ